MFDSHYVDAVLVLQTVRNNPLSHLQKNLVGCFGVSTCETFSDRFPNVKKVSLFFY